MAVKKKATGKALVNWEERMAEDAAAEAAREKTTGNFISLQGGEFSYDGAELPNPLNVVVLGFSFENAYYTDQFDPDNPASPVCFAMSTEEDGMKPHPDSTESQCDNCDDCWANEFASAATGRGKACKNTRRLAVAAADELDGAGDETTVLMMRLPPTSIKAWKGYVNQISKVKRRPPYGVFTAMHLEKEKSYYVVKPEYVGNVPDAAMQTVVNLREMSEGDLMANTYQAPSDEDEKPTDKKRAAPSKKRAAPAKKRSSPRAATKKRKF